MASLFICGVNESFNHRGNIYHLISSSHAALKAAAQRCAAHANAHTCLTELDVSPQAFSDGLIFVFLLPLPVDYRISNFFVKRFPVASGFRVKIL